MPRVRAEVFPSIHLHRLGGKWLFAGPILRFQFDLSAFQRAGIEEEVAVGSALFGVESEGIVAAAVESVGATEGACLNPEGFHAQVEEAGRWEQREQRKDLT
jgi:hypothetical protein